MAGEGRSGEAASAVALLGDRRARPDPIWVARLTGASTEAVASALGGLDSHRKDVEQIRERLTEGGRSFYAQIRAPFELYAIARLLRPESVVETGVSAGVSSAHFLMALRDNRRGRLHSIDLPTRQHAAKLGRRESPVSLPPGRTTGWAVPPELTRRWDLRIGASQTLLAPVVRDSRPIGVFLHDSLHTPRHLTFELETVRKRLAPGAIVLADNTEWTGHAFDRFARSLGVPVVRRGRSDLVGLRVPTEGTANGPGRGARSRATR
jgi:predicted O-methyltransferase YrrM